jgi:hypothetical protein
MNDIAFEGEKKKLVDALLQNHAPHLQSLILVNEEIAIDGFVTLLRPLVTTPHALPNLPSLYLRESIMPDVT